MVRKLFGTDGIRGIANRHPMTAEIALQVGRAVASYFKGKSNRVDRKSVILIGKDTRLSSYMVEQALAAGVTSQGAFALLVGPMPTPGIAYLTKSMRADAGLMVSASHNSYEYNGIKLIGHDGFKLDDSIEQKIEELILSENNQSALPTHEKLGRAKRIDDAMGRYVVHSKSTFPIDLDLRGIRVLLDTANGAAYSFAPLVFEELGAEVFQIGNKPNGTNINRDFGALHPKVCAEALRDKRADIGVSLDGDADRVILIDENGEVVDGDQLLAILAISLKDQGALSKDTLVVTPMSNMGLELALKEKGITTLYADVGDRSVVDLMRKGSYNLGGEQSGHIVLLDSATTGDGVTAALAVMAVMQRTGKPLSELKKCMTPIPQILRNVRVKKKPELEKIKSIQKLLSETETQLKGRGRVFLRYSGTEPLCRIMLEGENKSLLNTIADNFEELIHEEINFN
jgi:phosphoglucosamine mutase